MAATAKDVRTADVPDEVRKWWDTFNNGVTVNEQDDEEEPRVDSDSDFEQVAEEEQNAGVAASEGGGKITAAADTRVEEQGGDGGGGGAAARHGDDEEVSEDGNVQTQGVFLLGRKRKAIVTCSKPETTGTEIHDKNGKGIKKYRLTRVAIEEHISEDNYVWVVGGLQGRKRQATVVPFELTTGTKIQNKIGHDECLRAENDMLRLQLVRTTKELEAEQIRRLNLELDLKNEEIKSLKKQNEDLRAENEHYRKTAKPSRNPRLCRSCKEYVLGHDYRNCPKKRASASSEQDEEDDSS